MASSTPRPICARAHLLRAARGSSSKATCSTGGIRPAGAACARASPTTCSGCLTSSSHYVDVTGDDGGTRRGCRSSRAPLLPHEHEEYYDADSLREQATLYEHCVRALETACTSGAHGLPLIGSGDWNDGMNRVGIEGKGESVWLAWFLITTLRKFAPHAERRGDPQRARAWATHAAALTTALERRPGTATGIGVPTSTTERRWARHATTNAGSIRSRRAGRDFRRGRSGACAPGDGVGRRASRRAATRHHAALRRRRSTRRRTIPATSRAICRACAKMAAQYTHAAIWA